MGLNWAEGLKQAGQGLDQMSGIKMQEADYLYKEVAEQNRQRFRTSEREDEQSFITGERESKQTFESTESAKDRTSRDALTKATQEQTNAYREASLGVQRQRNEQIATGAARDDERQQAEQDQKVIDGIDERIAELQDPMYLGDQEQAASEVERLQQMKGLISEYGGVSGARAYLKIAGSLPKKPQAELYSSTYAMMTAEERKATDKRMLQLRRKGNDKAKAYVMAIDEYIDGGKAETPAQSGPSGDVKPPTMEMTVEGGAGPQKKMGPPVPDAAAPAPSAAKPQTAPAPRMRKGRDWKGAQKKREENEAAQKDLDELAKTIAQSKGWMSLNRISPRYRDQAYKLARETKERWSKNRTAQAAP